MSAFISSDGLVNGDSVHAASSPKRFVCPDCEFETDESQCFRQHYKTHLSATSPDPNQGPSAGVSVATKRLLPGLNPMCGDSRKRRKASPLLFSDVENDESEAVRTPPNVNGTAERTPAVSSVETVTNGHARSEIHPNLVKCPGCDFSFESQSKLEDHFIEVHRPEKRFKCSACDYSSKRAWDVDKHAQLKQDAAHRSAKTLDLKCLLSLGKSKQPAGIGGGSGSKLLLNGHPEIIPGKTVRSDSQASSPTPASFDNDDVVFLGIMTRHPSNQAGGHETPREGNLLARIPKAIMLRPVPPPLKPMVTDHPPSLKSAAVPARAPSDSLSSLSQDSPVVTSNIPRVRGNKFRCTRCNYVSGERKFVLIHIKQNHYCSKEYQCGLCGTKSLVRDEIKSHCLEEHGEVNIHSRVINAHLPKVSEINAKVAGKRSSDGITCGLQESLAAVASNSAFMQNNRVPEVHDFANMYTDTRNSTISPAPLNKTESASPFSCKDCPFSTSKLLVWREHVSCHTRRPYGKFMCSLCSFSVDEIEELKNHVPVHGCVTSEVTEKVASAVSSAAQSMLEPEETSVPTPRASHRPAPKQGATASKPRPFGCRHCPFATSARSKLKDHAVIHSGKNRKKPGYSMCRFCRAWPRASRLKNHLLWHSGKHDKVDEEELEETAKESSAALSGRAKTVDRERIKNDFKIRVRDEVVDKNGVRQPAGDEGETYRPISLREPMDSVGVDAPLSPESRESGCEDEIEMNDVDEGDEVEGGGGTDETEEQPRSEFDDPAVRQKLPAIPLAIVTMDGEEKCVYMCRRCPEIDKHKLTIETHERMHLPENVVPVDNGFPRCSVCPFFACPTGTSLSQHEKFHKMDIRILSLVDESQPDAPKPNLKSQDVSPRHRCRTESGEVLPRRKATVVGKPEGSERRPRRSAAVVIKPELPPPRRLHFCPQCPFFRTDAISIAQHLKCHRGVGSITCDSCDYATNQALQMKRHAKVHDEGLWSRELREALRRTPLVAPDHPMTEVHRALLALAEDSAESSGTMPCGDPKASRMKHPPPSNLESEASSGSPSTSSAPKAMTLEVMRRLVALGAKKSICGARDLQHSFLRSFHLVGRGLKSPSASLLMGLRVSRGGALAACVGDVPKIHPCPSCPAAFSEPNSLEVHACGHDAEHEQGGKSKKHLSKCEFCDYRSDFRAMRFHERLHFSGRAVEPNFACEHVDGETTCRFPRRRSFRCTNAAFNSKK